MIEPAAPIQQRWVADQWQADIPLAIQRTEDPTLLPAVLTMPGQPGGFAVTLTKADPAPTSAVPTPASTTHPGAVLLTLGLALLGGVLLNLMPCVFPVLSLKVLGAAQSGQSRRGLIGGSLAYTAGVVLSTLSLGGLLLALRAAGEHLGWGFQLQSPMFIAVLAIVFTLIGLNLAGVFEVGNVLPQRVATLRSRHHTVDHFLTGVLTVALASPCTAPFMGAALGAALALPTSLALAIFAALGLGIAAPYIVATWVPGLTARLPRPGPWMTQFKILMAFPMFATVIWLLWVLGQQVDIHGVMSVLKILLTLALVVWIFGASGLGRRGRWLIGVPALALLILVGMWGWPNIRQADRASEVPSEDPVWQTWSDMAVASARRDGQPVFVDFTAAWCITCQVNKRTTLSDGAVMAAFKQHNVRLLRADWTTRDPQITQELRRLGRSGVPVYALYDPGKTDPTLLPEILMPSTVLKALADMTPGNAGSPTQPSEE